MTHLTIKIKTVSKTDRQIDRQTNRVIPPYFVHGGYNNNDNLFT